MRLLIDGIAFCRGLAAARALWDPLLARLAQAPGLEVHVLDRGEVPGHPGLQFLPFPDHGHENAAADSVLLQAMCDQFAIDVFCSTGWTTPLCTPTVAVVSVLPPVPAAESAGRHALEPWAALAFAQRYLCVGDDGLRNLQRAMPEIPDCQFTAVSWAHDDSASLPVDALCVALVDAIGRVCEEARGGTYEAFFKRWAALRRLQAEVDYKG